MRGEIEEAVRLLKSADPDSLEKALTLLQDSVFSFSMRVCNQREDAEDTMQEVLAKSLSVLPKFDNPKALVVWLYKVAKSRCLMSRRKSKFAPAKELSLDELMPDRGELAQLAISGGINPEAFAIHSQEAQWLRDAIQKVPTDYRIVLVLRDMEGLSDDEVAEITGLRPGTVRVRLHRARLFVRKEISKRLQADRKVAAPLPPKAVISQPRPAQCKAMFAELSDYLDEKLDDSMCSELEKHIDGCEPCKAFVESLQNTITALRDSAGQPPDPKLAKKLRKDLIAGYSAAMSQSSRR
ncbi:MAG TPA: sigma-70 family RNA polymerase sigma factor [Terriglobales bacterium]